MLNQTLGRLTRLSLVFSTLLLPAFATASEWVFTKIVDTATEIPGSLETFNNFTRPSFDGESVAFRGVGPTQFGVYTNAGGALRVVADKNTMVPNGTGNFLSFSLDTSLDSGAVGFEGFGIGGGGAYAHMSGTLQVVADRTTAIPSGIVNFGGTGVPWLNGGNAVFFGQAPGGIPVQNGIYSNISGTVDIVADLNTSVPGGAGNFLGFKLTPSLDGNFAAFAGLDAAAKEGVYTNLGGSLRVVADTNTPIPGGTGNFTRLAGLDGAALIDGETIAFRGSEPGIGGIYVEIEGSLQVVADTNTAVPSETGTFDILGTFSLDGGQVAFRGNEGSGDLRQGIYIFADGGLSKIINLSDTLDNKTIQNVRIGPQGLKSGSVAFLVEFSDGSKAIYRADPLILKGVAIDIKPGSELNSINTKSKGVISVAILGSDTLDVLDVDRNSLAFGSGGATPKHSHLGHLSDVNDDGMLDLVSHYGTKESGIQFGDVNACISGNILDGTPFEACDSIRTVK
jgi:hypothetical protein